MRERGVILVVSEDQTGAAGQLSTILVEHGYAIVTAPGDVARAKAALSDAPHVMVVDTELGDVDPFSLVADLQDAASSHDLPVIFMAPAVDLTLRVRSLEAGDDVISTPLHDREVLERIARQVSVSKVRMAHRESEAKFRSAMESAIDAIIYADDQGRIRSWNSAATALFGHTEQEAMGRPLELIIPERFRDLHRAGIERVSAGGPTHAIGSTFEVAALRRDGGEVPSSCRSLPGSSARTVTTPASSATSPSGRLPRRSCVAASRCCQRGERSSASRTRHWRPPSSSSARCRSNSSCRRRWRRSASSVRVWRTS